MPRVSVPRTELIAELGEQLRFTAKRVLVRHLDAIDELALQVDPEGMYPEDFVVFRVTGYRPDINEPRLIPGEALRGDLSALAERLSESAGLTEADLHEPVETILSLTERWGVTRRTLERYRRLGLVARRVDLGSGRRALVFSRAGIEAFERVHADRLEKAAGFARLGDAELQAIWSRARRYRSRLGWSLNRVAQRISAQTGRSPEGVRRVLKRMDRNAADPVFPEPGPPTRQDRMLAVRAVRRGIEPITIAKRTSRRKNAISRALNDGRADLLRSLELPATDSATSTIPSGPMVESDLLVHAPIHLVELIERMRERVTPVAVAERVRGAAYRALVRSAARAIEDLPSSTVSGAVLDEIETSLRWASMLKAVLVSTQLRLAIDTLEGRLGGPLETLPPGRAGQLAKGAISSVGEAVDRFDPSRGGRLAAPAAIALQRWCSHVPDVAAPTEPGRAARRAPAGVVVPDWTRRLAPWQVWLDPDPRIAGVLGLLEEEERLLLVQRFGLLGDRPMTLDEIARSNGKQSVHLARAERRAIRHALRAFRESE